jgi:HEAT repeat protein
MLERDAKARPVAIRALAALGDTRAVRPLLAKLSDDDRAVRAEAVRALAALVDEQHAAEVQQALTELLQRSPEDARETIIAGLRTIASRFGNKVRAPEPPRQPSSALAHHSVLVGHAPSGVAPLTVAVGQGQVGAEPPAPMHMPL